MSITLAVVCFPDVAIDAQVNSIGGADYPSGTVASDLPGLNPQFFPGRGVDGQYLLCTTKTTDAPLLGVFGNHHTIAVLAPPTVVVGFVGGRPDDRR